MRPPTRPSIHAFILLLVGLLSAPNRACPAQDPGTIHTLAGGGGPGAPSASLPFLGNTYGLALDPSGNLYVAEPARHRILRVSPDGTVAPFAGKDYDGTPGRYSGDGGLALEAELASPQGLATDSMGNLYIADTGNARVRKVTPQGVISTVAGTGQWGDSGDGGPATVAKLGAPFDVEIDSSGGIYIADAANNKVRRVRPDGVIRTVAGTGWSQYPTDGVRATSSTLNAPRGIALDRDGNLYIADTGNHNIRRVARDTGIITSVAVTGSTGVSEPGGPTTGAHFAYPVAVAVHPSGALFITDFGNHRILRVDGQGVLTLVHTGNGLNPVRPEATSPLAGPGGLVIDSGGSLYFTDTDRQLAGQVWKLDAGGQLTLLAGRPMGSRTDGALAHFALLSGIAVAPGGEPVFSDSEFHALRKALPDGDLLTVAGVYPAQYLYLQPDYNDSNPNRLYRGFSGDGGPAVIAMLSGPGGLAYGQDGSLYVADSGNHLIRRISPVGVITTVAGVPQTDPMQSNEGGFSGDGGPALQALLKNPTDVAVDDSGALYIADTGNHRIRRVAPDGTISTVAGKGPLENSYWGGFSGDGGPATDAYFNIPSSVVTDPSGNLYIADSGNLRIRKVTPDGKVQTFAGASRRDSHGNTIGGFRGDGGPATSALFGGIRGLTLDSVGNLYVADMGNNRIRRIGPDGVIHTVAGSGAVNAEGYGIFSGDGGPALQAGLAFPTDVAIDAEGSLYLTDMLNRRVRVVLRVAAPGMLAGAPMAATGDVTRDGLRDVGDAVLALRDIVGTAALPPEQAAHADMDGDGSLSVTDVVTLLRALVFQ